MLVVARPDLAVDEAAEPLGDVADPPRLAVLAVADDVDADARLLAHDPGDLLVQRPLVSSLVVRLPIVARDEDVADRHRSYEAADVGDENAVGAAVHEVPSVFMIGQHTGDGKGSGRAARDATATGAAGGEAGLDGPAAGL